MSVQNLEVLVTREMLSDHLSAQRLAIAWLMARLCPEDAQEWLTKQHEEIKANERLGEVGVELGLIQEDLMQLIRKSTA